MSVNTKINWKLLIHAAQNRLDEDERAELLAWIAVAPDRHQQILDDIARLYGQKNRKKKLPDQVFNRFISRYGIVLDPEPRSRVFRPLALRAAAAIAAILICGGLFLFLNRDWVARQYGQGPVTLAWKEIRAATGKQVMLTLPDGSQVRLAPGSSLRYPEAFNDTQRLVQLVGSAFFEIRKNPEQPFLVQAPELTTRVLGTSFQVIAYPGETRTSVTVVTGKVAVSRNRKGQEPLLLASLSPEEKIVLNLPDDSVKVSAVSAAQATAVRDGKLVFDNSSLAEVAERLRVQYGISVHLANEQVAARRITATFDPNISMQDLSDILGEVAQLKVHHDNNNLYIGQ
ncbi:FecR family protein [Taibaiella chishuiensis]|uniref:FecR family protein n=1 Tax=Taibaiella chishuiensis TaxID=1434707 RepID=A0A2P8D0I6_9BACT|nr:FecR domain-containing protein [Taibaiella chishuiensis]PSK90730.1 FecR family protein [Taibaiella chishuiensis]